MWNPEFRRNLLLEWSTHRLVLVGGILAAIFVLVSLIDPRGFGNVVANVALALFILTTMAWGGHRAGDAILDELRDRTWDSQRMSALDPWTMTWGKLCGATIMPWLAGGVCLVVYVFSRYGPTGWDRAQVMVTMLAGAILIQALSLIGALVGTRLDKQGKSTLTSWAAAGTLGLLWLYFSTYLNSDNYVVWYGNNFSREAFLCVSMLSLAAWATFGAYRLMCTELAVATRPWAWLVFCAYLTAFFAGGIVAAAWPGTRTLGVIAATGLMVTVGGTYIGAFALYRDPLTFRRLLAYAKAGRFRRFLEETPIWIASLVFAYTFVLLCSVLQFAPRNSLYWIENVGLSAITIGLYPLRDIAILYYFTYGASNKRVESSTIISLAMLYWLIPSIIESLGFIKASWPFRPPMQDRPLLSAAIVGVHVVIAVWICYRRYRQRVAPTAPPPAN